MPIRRILGESTTAPASEPVVTILEQEDAPVISEPVPLASDATDEATSAQAPVAKDNLVDCLVLNHLVRYQVLGAVLEPMGNFLAPTVHWVSARSPASLVSGIKRIDSMVDGVLVSIDSVVVPEFMMRTPNHEKGQVMTQTQEQVEAHDEHGEISESSV